MILDSRRRLTCRVAALFCSVTIGRHAAAQQWAIPDAPYRAVVRAGKEAPTSPDTGCAIEIPEMGQTMANLADVVLLDAKGQFLPIAKVFRAEGSSAILLAQTLTAGQDHFLYFGGNRQRRDTPWQPKISVLMETRRLPAGTKLDDWPALDAAWKHATPVDGAGFVPLIDKGENPFGDDAGFISHFTGWLRTDGKHITLYTLSSDASFVLVGGRLAFGWPGIHDARANKNTVPRKEVDTLPGATQIDYYQAKAGDAPPTMLLGWDKGKDEVIPPSAWLHPAASEIVRIEQAQGWPPPLVDVRVHSYMGWNGLWLYDAECSLRGPLPAGWTAEWDFDDGSKMLGEKAERVLRGPEARSVRLLLSHGKDQQRGLARIAFAGSIPEAKTEQAAQRERYLSLLDRENPALLSAETLKADFQFVSEFGTDQQIGKFATSWMAKTSDVNDPLWLSGELAHLRSLAQSNPQQAIAELHRVDGAAHVKYAKQLAVAELEILVFYLKDPAAIQVGNRVAFDFPNTDTARLAKIRIGDLYRLLGKTAQAVEQYRSVQKSIVDETQGRKYAAEDRSDSITISDLIDKQYRHEAAEKVIEWELAHPMAKYDSDLLLVRGRVLMLFGRWSEALQEIDSFRQMQPDSPYQIPADFYRARALFELGKKDEARKIWTELASKYPKHELASESRRLAAQK